MRKQFSFIGSLILLGLVGLLWYSGYVLLPEYWTELGVGLTLAAVALLSWGFKPDIYRVLKKEPQKKSGLFVELLLHSCSHYRKDKQSILEIDFELSNPTEHQTSIRELRAWVIDGTDRLEGVLQVLWDYRALAKIGEPYDPERRPIFEQLHLPHNVAGDSTERYVVLFDVGTLVTGEDAKCGLVVKHTHGEVKCEGVSHPSPLQRIAGLLAQEKDQRQPDTVPKEKASHNNELLILLRKLLIRWQQYMELSDRPSEFSYRENMKSFAIGLSDQFLELDSTYADSWDFGLRNQVQRISNELRQFGLGLESPLPELLEAAETHGLMAYETARALVSFLEPKQA
jgi:hypothetical protein